MAILSDLKAPARLYLKTLLADKKRFVRVNFIQASIAICNLAFPIMLAGLFALLVRHFGGGEAQQGLPPLIMAVIEAQEPVGLAAIFLVLLFVIDLSRNYLMFTLQAELDAQATGVYRSIANRAISRYLKLDYEQRSKQSSHRLQSLITQLLFAAKGLQTGLVGRVIPTAFEAIIALIVVVALFGPMYLFLFGGLLISFICFSFMLSRTTDEAQSRFQATFSQAAASIGDALSLHDQIVSFGGQEKAKVLVSEAIEDVHGAQIHALKSHQRFSFLQSATVMLFAYAMLALLTYQIFSGIINVAALVLLTTYIFQFTAPLNTIGVFIRNSVRHFTVISEVQRSFMPDIANDAHSSDALISGSFEIRDVDPSVKIEKLVFQRLGGGFKIDINTLEVSGAKDVAIVGQNGSGKSTFARLLSGQLPATSGAILANGINLTEVDMEETAKIVRYVPQSGQLFRKSVPFNVFFPLDEGGSRIEEAMQIFSDLQASPQLIERLRGKSEDSASLSGGEVQKVLLARAIFNPAPVMILDEATSDLDATSTAVVRDTMRKWCNNSLIFYITHSPEFAESCDQTLTFDNGQVVNR